MVVRHPFQRLISAFENKFNTSYNSGFYNSYAPEIISRARSQINRTSSPNEKLTFPEFIKYIVNLDQTNFKRAFNEHWRPISDLCFPCKIRFDFILKLESVETESNYLLKHILNISSIKFPHKSISPTVPPSLFKVLDVELIKKLITIYRKDFEIFNFL